MRVFLRKKYTEYIIIILLFILAIFSRNILSYFTGSNVPLAVVEGYSMWPTLRQGDLVIAYKPLPNDIHVGDIIIYKDYRGTLIIHRVIEVFKKGDKYYYITKGDNNLYRDPIDVPYERVEGKVITINNIVIKVPYLGYLSLWSHGLGYII